MNAVGKLCVSAFCSKKQIQIILQMSDSTTLLYMCKKVFWDVKFLISCEPHCQKFKTCFIYDFKTVINNELQYCCRGPRSPNTTPQYLENPEPQGQPKHDYENALSRTDQPDFDDAISFGLNWFEPDSELHYLHNSFKAKKIWPFCWPNYFSLPKVTYPECLISHSNFTN